MSKSPESAAMKLACLTLGALWLAALTIAPPAKAAESSGPLGIGRVATAEELAAWDIDVRADGKGLPQGRGNAADGEAIFAEKCANCHGDFAEGTNRWTVLAGGRDTLKSDNPVKTVGSYWPFISSAYDYIYRSMPFGNAQSLKPDEVYALIAYILLMNDLIEDDAFEVSNESLPAVKLPNAQNFVEDGRPDTPTVKDGEPCMKDCKPPAKVTMRANTLDVTPEGEESGAARSAVE